IIVIYLCVLPLLAARAILSIIYTVLIYSIITYSHCLDRLFLIIVIKLRKR
ncbi:hypothetical protein CMEL01_06142, partial [Colletotrichum melonis]